MTALRFLQVFQHKSVRTYADAGKILGVSRQRVHQMVSLATKLPLEITDFLSATEDPAVLRHFTERRLRPLTLLADDPSKIARFHGMLRAVQAAKEQSGGEQQAVRQEPYGVLAG